DPVAKKVQLVLDERVQPSLAQHGGWIELVEVSDGVAYVQLGGGCQGCSGAQATLSEGIRHAIIEQVPEISDVVDRTDHGAGTNPFMSH
ncbi:MAG TPA: iron-sulfur cluster assembly accessory protein, partial [Acidobacteria bacterium]|nr:iron-sulfur cluster assembly accessory protein [Acidobacteriota bacterium]